MSHASVFFGQCNGAVLFLSQWLVERNVASVWPLSTLNKAVAHAVNKSKREHFYAGKTFKITIDMFAGYRINHLFAHRLDHLVSRKITYCDWDDPIYIEDCYCVQNQASLKKYTINFKTSVIPYSCSAPRMDVTADAKKICYVIVFFDSVFFRCYDVEQWKDYDIVMPYSSVAPDCPLEIVVDQTPRHGIGLVTATAFLKSVRRLENVVYTKNHLAYLLDAFIKKINER